MSLISSPYQIFDLESKDFLKASLEVFHYQALHCDIYKAYIQQLDIDVNKVSKISDIPFLPIQFFKTHKVLSTNKEPEMLFESSATTSQVTAKHYIIDSDLYKASIQHSFAHAFGPTDKYMILGLLPHYLERKNSSLVYMVQYLMQESGQDIDGFFLDKEEELINLLRELERKKQATILFGVTFALLDLAAKYSLELQYTQLVETGGMKGRKSEMTREVIHQHLHKAFGNKPIFSEYGMAELLSQSYYNENKVFSAPHWKKVLIRDVYDPFHVQVSGKGAINIIDLANIHSCSFIATDDIGRVYEDGNFDIQGRLDASEVRGCNLLLQD